LDPLGLVELPGGPDEAEVAFVDQVAEGDALVLILLGDRDDEAEVRSDQLVERLLVALLDQAGELRLLLPAEEWVCTDLLEVLVEGPLLVSPSTRGSETHAALRAAATFSLEVDYDLFMDGGASTGARLDRRRKRVAASWRRLAQWIVPPIRPQRIPVSHG